MDKKKIQRPDETALLHTIEKNKDLLAETLLLLAWKVGLTNDEIYHLKWTDFSFEEGTVAIEGRTVPLEEVCCQRFLQKWQERGCPTGHVVVNSRSGQRIHKVSLSNCARTALDEGGLTEISMADLRRDYIIRQLEQHDCNYVASVSGVGIRTLYTSFADYLPSKREGRSRTKSKAVSTEPFDMQKLINKEGATPEVLAIYLSWKYGMHMNEIDTLEWEQIDWEKGSITLKNRSISMDELLKGLLEALWKMRTPSDAPMVLLSPNSRHPYTHGRLSSAVKTVLIRSGMKDETMETLSRKKERGEEDTKILTVARENGYISRNEVMELLSLTKQQAYIRLRRLSEEGQLINIGRRYYPRGSVVPPEQHDEVILNYMGEYGGAYRKEIAELLHIEERQCSWILSCMVEDGKLAKDGQRYVLKKV